MTRSVFLDTSLWVAAAVPGLTGHDAARAVYAAAVRQGLHIVTTPMVMGETHSLLLRLQGRDRARAGIDAALADPTHVIMPVDHELVRSAVDRWVMPYRDQQFSLCDAVSFEVMRREKIGRALARDRHFQTAGFELF